MPQRETAFVPGMTGAAGLDATLNPPATRLHPPESCVPHPAISLRFHSEHAAERAADPAPDTSTPIPDERWVTSASGRAADDPAG
jgi:hypothetical protein